jgi:hypothetical protein
MQPMSDADASVALLTLRVNDCHLRIERVGELSVTWPTLTPLQKTTAGDAQYLAEPRNQLPARLCFDPGVPNRDSLAKYAAAFLSTSADASSRRSRSTSASSSFAERGVADTPIDAPSLLARSSLTQLNKLESGIPRLRLASDTPTLWSSLTA